MRPFLIITIIFFLVTASICLCPISGEAQYPGFNPFLEFQLMPFFPQWIINPFFLPPVYTGRYFGMSRLPMPISSPFIVEPILRMANIPPIPTIPAVTITTAPLTAILNLIDPALLASNIAILTTNFPLVFNLLVTTFQLPI